MARRGKRVVFSEAEVERARVLVGELKQHRSLLRALVVLLAKEIHLTGEQISSLLGVSKSTLVRMNKRFRDPGPGPTRPWGGDRRSLLTVQAQEEVLAGLAGAAAEGKVVVVAQVKAALEAKRAAPVSLQTAYNTLHRAGWRKVKPDKRHPKSDPQRQEEFKKKPFRTRWCWRPPKLAPPASPCGSCFRTRHASVACR